MQFTPHRPQSGFYNPTPYLLIVENPKKILCFFHVIYWKNGND
ncbi:hypothetical protein NBRC3257_0143 [Gluconobacter thailandicus NBRC 3257]|uniref:Transposase n=1 Tax=Gluconobacter thailandicus NBRC 3257 TaxID=1381097 RepID=A0ABQ0ISF2_GLUTH|nr:hypothetical protein NBRC3257_0143 [Gluconobacter thailandicus NBRC 3257]